MCVIVDLDLVVPAIISLEFSNMRYMEGYSDHSEKYLSAMTISLNQIMNYAARMKSWDLGRVVVNFNMEDAIRYLQSNPDIFEQIDHSQVYLVRLPHNANQDKDALMSELIEKLVSKINYSPRVLRTVGLLHD